MRTMTGRIGYLQRVPEDQGEGWLLGIVGDTVPYRRTPHDMTPYREGQRVAVSIDGPGRISDVMATTPATAPAWNCVDYPDGMHLLNHEGGCSWCGFTRDQIRAERANAPVYHPATPELRASWSVLNPRGVPIHYQSYTDAQTARDTGVF